ncbi:MAG: hypothetical protein AAB638_02375 [Patescibacteria group bacterium]
MASLELRDEIQGYLAKTFGAFRSCHCGVVSPEHNEVFEVVEPLQTCHTSTYSGMDEHGNLPTGVYKIERHEVRDGGGSHYIYLAELGSSRKASFYCGYGVASLRHWREMVDWRGVRKPSII